MDNKIVLITDINNNLNLEENFDEFDEFDEEIEEKFKVKVTPIKSQGKKTKLVPWIIDTFETLNKNNNYLYIEPFVGTGVVGFNIAPKNAIFSDVNPHLINFYKAIQNKEIDSLKVRKFLESESLKLINSPSDKSSYYYTVRDRFNKFHDPLDFLFLTRSCFNGMMRFNKKGGFNVPFCKKPNRFAPALITKISNQVLWLEKLIHNNDWMFVVEDYKRLMSYYKKNKDVVYYLDPPYILRSADYFNSWHSEDESNLHDLVNTQEGQFIMSTWFGNKYRHNPYIEDFWSKFEILQKEHTYHLGPKIKNRNDMTEALIIKRF